MKEEKQRKKKKKPQLFCSDHRRMMNLQLKTTNRPEMGLTLQRENIKLPREPQGAPVAGLSTGLAASATFLWPGLGARLRSTARAGVETLCPCKVPRRTCGFAASHGAGRRGSDTLTHNRNGSGSGLMVHVPPIVTGAPENPTIFVGFSTVQLSTTQLESAGMTNSVRSVGASSVPRDADDSPTNPGGMKYPLKAHAFISPIESEKRFNATEGKERGSSVQKLFQASALLQIESSWKECFRSSLFFG